MDFRANKFNIPLKESATKTKGFFKQAPFLSRLQPLVEKVTPFFHRLQWKLTLTYTLFTVGTILLLAVVALALLWYLNFQSSIYPNALADGLSKGVAPLAAYLDQAPPDQAGLQSWLQETTKADHLILSVPKENIAEDEDPNTLVPGNFGEIKLAAIVDPEGVVLAAKPDGAVPLNQPLQPQLSAEAADVFQAALRGETETADLATRGNGNLTVSAPILGDEEQLLGAMIFTTASFPVSEGEFLQNVLQRMILPFAGIMLFVGIIVGALFGFLVSRGLTRRLRLLSQAADAWSEGNFRVLAQDNSGDELGRLARHLNHTALQLQNLLQTRQELAGLEERNRLARDLHDSVKQQVFATAMQVGAAKALIDRSADQAKTHLVEAEQLVRQAQQELTTLILELRPAALEGKGLTGALKDYVADWSRQTKITAEVRLSGERPLPLPVEQTLFRVAQEALANVARHSRASAADIHLSWQSNSIRMVVTDNGRGFEVNQVNGKGVGLQSMQERIEMLGGYFNVKSKPDRGTQITARVPDSMGKRG